MVDTCVGGIRVTRVYWKTGLIRRRASRETGRQNYRKESFHVDRAYLSAAERIRVFPPSGRSRKVAIEQDDRSRMAERPC